MSPKESQTSDNGHTGPYTDPVPSKSELPALADQIGVPQRTLRRAVTRGTIHCRRPGPRRFEIDPDESAYLKAHSGLLTALQRALRTERAVRLGVLLGSVARGGERPDSDIDLLVDMTVPSAALAAALELRLTAAIGREVSVVLMSQALREAPALVLSALGEGRVLVDREERWMWLNSRRERLERDAGRRRARQKREASQALRDLANADGP